MQVKVFQSCPGLQECELLWDQPKALRTFTKIVSDKHSYIYLEREGANLFFINDNLIAIYRSSSHYP